MCRLRVSKILSLLSTLKRDSITILADILKAVSLSKSSRKMAIVYKANLNFERIKRYLDFLIATGLIENIAPLNESESYRITVKGREFLEGYSRLVNSLKTTATGEALEVSGKAALVSPT